MLLDAMPDQKASSLSSFLASYIALIKANSRLEWVIAEISEISDRNNSHIYLDLIEQDASGQIVAKCKAAIWKGMRGKVLDTFAQGTGGGRLAKGMKVMVQVRAGMHIQYGFSLVVENINPQFTLGEAERKLREIRARLTSEGIINRNRALVTPTDFTRVVVISPPAAAGLGDFRAHADLLANAGLCQFIYLSAAFQGDGSAAGISESVRTALLRAADSDCLVIIRGGGAQADLMWLNDYELAKVICTSPLPVMVGIGHERDKTILDEVACQSFHTPSKLIGHIFDAITGNAMTAGKSWDQIGVQATKSHERIQRDIRSTLQQISQLANNTISRGSAEVDRNMERIQLKSQSDIDQAGQNIELRISRIRSAADRDVVTVKHQITLSHRDVVTISRNHVDIARQSIDRDMGQISERAAATARETQILVTRAREVVFEHAARMVEQARSGARSSVQYVLGMGPTRTLQRGFVMAKQTNGKILMRSEAISPGDSLTLSFADGDVTTNVKQVTRKEIA
jgi:exodeoxyribonuclease VII large subunit